MPFFCYSRSSESVKLRTAEGESQDEYSGTNKSEFNSLLRDLKLDPKKELGVMNAISVDSYTFSNEEIQSPEEIPKYILHRLMIVDYDDDDDDDDDE